MERKQTIILTFSLIQILLSNALPQNENHTKEDVLAVQYEGAEYSTKEISESYICEK